MHFKKGQAGRPVEGLFTFNMHSICVFLVDLLFLCNTIYATRPLVNGGSGIHLNGGTMPGPPFDFKIC